ncbi:MAG: thiamine biosynthesis protein ThiJ [Thermotogaceae bacterium]|nr:thiamine biosynthesis protein ThiJ [Thermotogaceae bacterium]
MNKRLLVYYYENMADFELSGVAVIAGWFMGYRIDSFARSMEPVKSLTGLVYQPTLAWQELKHMGADAFDGLIIPGGNKPEFHDDLMELIREFNDQSKLVAAICAGPQYLGKAGILNGRRFTASFTPEEIAQKVQEGIFPSGGWTSEKVVQDQNVITADGFSFIDFGIAIGDYFHSFKTSEEKENIRKALKGL